MELTARERTDLAAFLAELTPDELDAPSLCSGWRVRDVAAHVVSYDVLGWRGSLALLARHRVDVDAANEAGVREAADLPFEVVLERLRRHRRPRGITALFGGGVGPGCV